MYRSFFTPFDSESSSSCVNIVTIRKSSSGQLLSQVVDLIIVGTEMSFVGPGVSVILLFGNLLSVGSLFLSGLTKIDNFTVHGDLIDT